MDIKKFNYIGNANSKGYYADYKFPMTVDGEGIRGSVYLSGCLFNCKGCYNKKIQNFKEGRLLDAQVVNKIMIDLDQPQVQGLSILGGEPMLNTKTTLELVSEFRKRFRDTKDIWLWTGYTWEELLELTTYSTDLSKNQREILENIDVLVDGQFIDSEHDSKLAFRGSKNQRIIDVSKTLRKSRLGVCSKNCSIKKALKNDKNVILWQENQSKNK